MGSWRSAIGWTACALLGCRAPKLPAVASDAKASDHLPTLRLRWRSTTLDASPASAEAEFAIGPQGSVVLRSDGGDRKRLTLLDSTGRVVARIGISGSGPGEVLAPQVIDVGDSAVLVTDDRQARLTLFSLNGTSLHSTVTAQPIYFPVAISDTALVAMVDVRGSSGPALISATTGQAQMLLSGPDSFFVASFPARGVTPDRQAVRAVLGRWAGGFIAADAWNYTLAYYDWDGSLRRLIHRDLPAPQLSAARAEDVFRHEAGAAGAQRSPADAQRLRDVIGARRQPYFAQNRGGQIGLDGRGRNWVVGIDADSGFADLFDARRFIGRIALPCRGFTSGWSVKANWLALACAPDDPEYPGDAVLKVFHIVD